MMGRGGPQNLRSFLNPIANYCRANELPPLTITVVNSDGSLSDTSYISDNIDKEREEVFSYAWFQIMPPTIAELEQANSQ